MKDKLYIIGIILVAVVLYGLTLHGVWGNPGAWEVHYTYDVPTKPFELSPERGRYAHVYSLAETGTYTLTKTWADVVYPDAGVIDGKYFSFFAPGVSYMATPFYMIGRAYNLGQVFTFGFISFIATCSLVLLYMIGRKILALPRWATLASVFFFGFASTSWGYAITLYQHHVTVFLTLLAFYSVWKFRQKTWASGLWAVIVGVCYGLSVFVDYPNALFLLPVMIYFLVSVFGVTKETFGYVLRIRWVAIVAVIACLAVTGLQFAHNNYYYGNWKMLSGGLPSYHLATETIATTTDAMATSSLAVPVEKDVVGFFHEQYIPRDFYILFFSSDRGLFFFSPLFLLALVGIYVLRKKLSTEHIVLLSVIAANIFLYCSWGDPWGGWAFGPRYLILSMSVLSLFIGVALQNVLSGLFGRSLTFILASFSSFVALLGALTTNAIPPLAEGLLLPAHKYNYLLNLQFLQRGESASFVFNSFFYSVMSLSGYFVLMYLAVLALLAGILFILPLFDHE